MVALEEGLIWVISFMMEYDCSVSVALGQECLRRCFCEAGTNHVVSFK